MPKISKPLVTIITITFNLKKGGREKYFRQCVDSVHAQTYENIEHIIVDGASEDGTLDLIKEYADKGWIRYISEPDKGVYDAMNKGIKLAKGKYIAFLHSDDFYHNKRSVELSVDGLGKNKSDYSFADTRGIDHKSGKLAHFWHGNINRIPFGTHYCHQSMFIKTDLIKKMGGFNISYKISADSDLMTKLVAKNKKYIYLPIAIVSYRSGGMSNEYIRETRKEHSKAFYNNLGKKEGLTLNDCFLIWNFSIFKEKNLFYCLEVGRKFKNKDWRREYLRNLFSLSGVRSQLRLILPGGLRKLLSNISFIITGK